MENFKFIFSNEHNPYFNLASEEYLLKQKEGFYVYLWINAPAVIVGINQNTLLEVNLKEAEKQKIKVVRRLTGGGAVYHDLNNICYTVIAPFTPNENNYLKFTSPIISYLKTLGITAEFSGRNDILIDNKKISGNAQVIYKDRIMHHGTLLFDTDMNALSNVLIANKLKTQSKGIKSVRSRVTNVSEYLQTPMSCNEFFTGLKNHIKKDSTEYSFTSEDIDAINKLVCDKYSTYEWNIGYSPSGNNRFDGRFSFGTITLTFDLKNGLIENAEFFGDYFAKADLQELSEKLNGKRFVKADLLSALSDIGDYIDGADANEIVSAIFS